MPTARLLFSDFLRRYFYSGWAFLIPYLAVYLLYYVTNWPVNPPTGPLPHSPSPLAPPPLLHLYWAIHAIHLILAALALRSWWTESSAQYVRNVSDSQSAPYSPYRLHLLTRIAPWAILALIFYIPGIYLEWPSDPWEHLRRINEWRVLDTVGTHSCWNKSSYFIPNSLLSWCVGLRQLFWLDFYYTSICLLLCWQYYKLARTCGLGERTAMAFVLIQTLLFGNNIFSFYRYYGISSSIYAQIGAISLTRIVLEFAVFGKTNLNYRVTCSLLTLGRSDHYSSRAFRTRPTFWHRPSTFRLLASGACLLLLMAFNHPQGIGIAGLGVAAVTVWRLIELKRSLVWWLIGGTVIMNTLFLWFYHRPAAIELYRVQGWLNSWYGINILDHTSPAYDRLLQVVGIFGLFNISAAAIFIFRNSLVAWLTILPLIALQTPLFAIPFATYSSTYGGEAYILTFQRLLFSIPLFLCPLTLLLCFQIRIRRIHQLSATTQWNSSQAIRHEKFLHRFINTRPAYYFLAVLFIAMLVTLPSRAPAYNRAWNFLSVTPADLRLLEAKTNTPTLTSDPIKHLISTFPTGTALEALTGEHTVIYAWRAVGLPSAELAKQWHHAILYRSPENTFAYVPSPLEHFTPTSIAGLLSTHWKSQQLSSDYGTSKELINEIVERGGVKTQNPPYLLYKYR